MLDSELYPRGGDTHHGQHGHHHHHHHHHHHYKSPHHRHYHSPSPHHHHQGVERERKSRSSPRHHHLQHSDGEKLKYQNAFGGSVGNIGGSSSSEKYHKYFPHHLLSGGSGTGGSGGYFDLSDKLDSLNLGGSRGSEKSSLISGSGSSALSGGGDSNNNHQHHTSGSASILSDTTAAGSGSNASGGSSKKRTIVLVGDGRSRVRRVVRTQTRQITVVSYSGRKKETETHTSHHATIVSFPQKIDRPAQIYSTHHHHPSSGGSVASNNGLLASGGSSSLGSTSLCGVGPGGGSYVYVQQQPQQNHQQSTQHYVSPQQLTYHLHSATGGNSTGNGYHHHGSHQNISTPTLHKKGSIRSNGDVLKRTRVQNAYELSQDLLDKQIELLERKYGGVKARNAALTIQRAFRHYTMVKKFASITAMAKAEKRMSRRVQQQQQQQQSELDMMHHHPHHLQPALEDGQIYATEDGTMVGQQRVCATISATPPGTLHHRVTPVRSMSLRERRLDSSPIPRSQSGTASPAPVPITSWSQSPTQLVTGASTQQQQQQQQQQQYSHPHVNILHQQQAQLAGYGYTPAVSAPSHAVMHHHQHQQQQQQQYQSQYGSQDLNVSGASSSSQLDSTISSMNLSWNSQTASTHQSPYTPHYTAAQIYMRPRGIGIGSSGGSSGSTSSASGRKVPPEVPKRTSSITGPGGQHTPSRSLRPNGLCKTAENGSLSSVQSSGSDSSASAERGLGGVGIELMGSSDRSSSPQWKRKGPGSSQSGSITLLPAQSPDHMLMSVSAGDTGGAAVRSIHSTVATATAATATAVSGAGSANVTIASIESECLSSHTSAAQYSMEQHDQIVHTPTSYKVSETIRKRQYRVGLNLFNKKPERGITYLIRKGFLENTPQGVARFLISRKGLSRQMIGEYLGNLQNPFNMAVLDCFAGELDLSGMQVDVALRKFQGYFRMPGEAQKIERLMEVFSARYCQCNSDIVARLRSHDTVFVLAFAIIMLNTDLHTPNLKPDRRMRCDDFVKNLRGIDDCHDIDRDMLNGIYERVKANEFKPGSDHVTQVMKVQATIVGKKPNLALPHRRLVCYCRLYEIPDINKKERPGVHQREVFLFNDLLVITKIFSKKKSSVTYTFRNSYTLSGMVVTLLDVPNYQFCIRLSQKVDGKVLVTFNARNEHDRCKFAEDLRESISEMDEMETLRIEAELERQKSARGTRTTNSENRDSGVADVEVCAGPYPAGVGSLVPGGVGGVSPNECGLAHSDAQLKRSALSNSLLDMHEQFGNEKPQRRGSVGSLDSGMSISFQSTSASTGSRSDIKVRMLPHSNTSGQIIMHAGQHPAALMGAIYHQQIHHHQQHQQQQQQAMGTAHHHPHAVGSNSTTGGGVIVSVGPPGSSQQQHHHHHPPGGPPMTAAASAATLQPVQAMNNGMVMAGTSTTTINPNSTGSHNSSGAIHRRERKPSRTEDAATVAALALAASAGASSAMNASSSSSNAGGPPNNTASGGNYGRSTEV
ncbi:IQ motif and SEC7 domain-containing protein 2-like [Anopheles marshallii]|uniref:IQ motif and SEC7 domain-containing protein 2-like n=1 Tax=Anopheles marshallii TaxID=1521116 RepID=UPI00237AC485|nr:IQ motif and SEC7 domain-containing protein 2-like [Anopheles marshallii]